MVREIAVKSNTSKVMTSLRSFSSSERQGVTIKVSLKNKTNSTTNIFGTISAQGIWYTIPETYTTSLNLPANVKVYKVKNGVETLYDEFTLVEQDAKVVAEESYKVYVPNDSSKKVLRAALGHALANSALVPILCVGDSETAGWKGTPGKDDPVTILRNLLRGQGFPVTGGWIFPSNGTSTSDTRLTFSGTWQGKTSTTSNFVYTTAQNAYVQFSPDLVGTTAEFTVFCTTNQNISYSIDGGTDVVQAITSGALRKITVTGLTSGLHTIRVIKTAATGTLWVGPARVRNTTGVTISNAGIFGAFAGDWLPTASSGVYYNPYNLSLGLETPKIVIVGLGANEALNAGAPSLVFTRLKAIVDAYKALGCVVILKTYMPPENSIVTAANPGFVWSDYVKAIYDVAIATGSILIDHTDLGTPTETKALGLMHTDNIHPVGPGYATIAMQDYRAMTNL